jgi:hypothetical protein
VSCIPKDYVESRFIKIDNKSNQNLIFVLSENGEFKKPFYSEDIVLLHVNETDSLSCSDFSWENMIQQSYNKRINIFIIKESILKKYNNVIDSVFFNQEYLNKHSFDIDYLERNNWNIVFK